MQSCNKVLMTIQFSSKTNQPTNLGSLYLPLFKKTIYHGYFSTTSQTVVLGARGISWLPSTDPLEFSRQRTRRSLPLIYSLVSRQTAHLPEAPREALGGVGTETPGGSHWAIG